MTDTKDLKAEAKTVWLMIKHYGSQTTAIISDMLKASSPQFTKAEATWKTYTPGKKTLAVIILAIVGMLGWKFSIDITRLSIGSFKAASAYGHGTEITKSDLNGFASRARVDELSDQIAKLKSDLASIDDKLDKAQSPIATGSLPAKKKPTRKSPAKKSSFSVADPSTWQMP